MRRRRSWHSLRLGAAARVVALVALLAPALWTRDTAALLALLAIGVMWLLGELSELNRALPVWLTTVLEPLTVSVICALALETTTAMLGALAVGPFTAGLRRGASGAVSAIGAQLAGLVVVAVALLRSLEGPEVLAIVTWGVAAMGLGMIATFLHSALRRDPDPLAPYHDAKALIRQLLAISDGFGSGLDPATLGGTLLDKVRDDVPASTLAVYVAHDRELSPLITRSIDPAADLGPVELLALQSWTTRAPVVDGQGFALPLVAGDAAVGVVAGRLSDRLDPVRIGLTERIRQLGPRLASSVVRLDTALLFEALRDRATLRERRRLAREIHDGLAQDIASLGYLVDALAAEPAVPAQAARIADLRRRISAVVAEVRRSVDTLRSGDEREMRLRPEVEAELFRIAQQAITNAVQHAAATTIDVHCRVHPPRAVITVRDDGCGLGPARPDSHGLAIMRERAELIGARLDVAPRRPQGTTVTVRLPAPMATVPVPPREENVTA
jgi:signal transduction histidine kinase